MSSRHRRNQSFDVLHGEENSRLDMKYRTRLTASSQANAQTQLGWVGSGCGNKMLGVGVRGSGSRVQNFIRSQEHDLNRT